MPIYEYLCQSCGHELEVIQKVADPLLAECPACAKLTLKKKLTAGAFRLSGDGWYETDFKTGDKKRNLAGDTGASGAGTALSQSGSGSAASGTSANSENGSDSTSGSKSAAVTK